MFPKLLAPSDVCSLKKSYAKFLEMCALSQKSNALAKVIVTSALGSVRWAHSLVNKLYSILIIISSSESVNCVE